MSEQNNNEVTKKTQEIHKAYQICKEVFEPSTILARQFFEINDEVERDFYELLFNFFFQQKHKEVIENEVY